MLKILMFFAFMVLTSEVVMADQKVPILLYHTWNVQDSCDYAVNDLLALEEDLQLLHDRGYTIVPLKHIAEWVVGDRLHIPAKSVGISLDDGHDRDFIDNIPVNHACGNIKSAHTILREFHERNPEHQPHATTFVIASRVARNMLDQEYSNDNWWGAANSSPYMSVGNHSIDHEHPVIQEKTYDPFFNRYLPAAGYADGEWLGKMKPSRITTMHSANIFVADAGWRISTKTGEWPTLFSHPVGEVSDFMKYEYLPQMEHSRTYAAFCTEFDTVEDTFVTRDSHRYCIPRFTFGWSWNSQEGLLQILGEL